MFIEARSAENDFAEQSRETAGGFGGAVSPQMGFGAMPRENVGFSPLKPLEMASPGHQNAMGNNDVSCYYLDWM